LGDAGVVHATLGEEPCGDPDVPLRPRAADATRSETLPVRALVSAADLPVDPAVAERLVECLVVGEPRRGRRSLLREDEPDAGLFAVMRAEPSPPSSCIAQDELGRVDAHL